MAAVCGASTEAQDKRSQARDNLEHRKNFGDVYQWQTIPTQVKISWNLSLHSWNYSFFFFLSDLQSTHSYPVNEVWYVHNLPGYGYKLRAWQFLILDLNVACI